MKRKYSSAIQMEKGFDPFSLKINDLRDEMRRRGLNPLGIKAVLLKRLSEALAKEDKTLEDFAKTLAEIKSPNKSITAVEANSVGSTEGAEMIPANVDSAVVDKGSQESSNDVSKPDVEKMKDDLNGDTPVEQPDSFAKVSIDRSNIQQKPDSTAKSAVEKVTEEDNGESSEDTSSHTPERENHSPQNESSTEKTGSEHSSDRHLGHSIEKDGISRGHSSDRCHHSKESSPKRGRDRSSDREGRRSSDRKKRRSSRKTRDISLTIEEEIEGWEGRDDVFLDFYNSDLSLVINQDCYSAKPMTNDGFALMWAGVRANYGVKSGKTYFEVKIVKELPVDYTDESIDSATHVLRVGWSVDKSSLILGEEMNSFGYDGIGKKSTDGKFEDYGTAFKEGDVVGAYVEFTDSEFIITFSVNGTDQGECFRFAKSCLGENAALFPHIYVKNVEFSVNFGQNDQPVWFPSTEAESWKLIGNVPVTERVRGLLPPAKKEDCEVIMMIGLPGCGKTYFAANLLKNNPEKYYNVLGLNFILEKMKVTGFSRKRNYSGRWDVIINKANQCLNEVISIAYKRKRNYVLDQTNVYPKVQCWKIRPFNGFKRKAIVIVPTDEEFKRRIEQRIEVDGKEVPEKALLEMKAHFRIPKPVSDDPTSMFDEVTFPELQREEAETLVNEYNMEGEASRSQERSRRRRYRRSRYNSHNQLSGRGDYDRREFRGSRFDVRGDDRGSCGSRSRDDYSRGGCDCCRFGGGGGCRYDEAGYRWGYSCGGYRHSPYGYSPFAHPLIPPWGPQYGFPPFYSPPWGRGGFNRGPPGPAERGGPDSYQRGGRGSYGVDYGPGSGYGYHQPCQRRRFDGSDSTDPSTGPPPSKQPAYGSEFRGAGYRGDSYRGGFRGGPGSGERGSFSGPSASVSGYAYGYESYPPTAGQSKGGDNSTPGRYPPGGRADEFQSKPQGPYAGSGSKPSRFSSAAGEADKSISKPSDSSGSGFRSSGYQGYEGGKESGRPPRSRFDQPGQQSQDPYGEGGTFGQPGAGRQSGPTGGPAESNGYGQYGQQQQGRNAALDCSKSQQGHYHGYGSAAAQSTGGASGKPGQQQRYGGDSSSITASTSSRGDAYGHHTTSQSKLDPRSYDYNFYAASVYVYGQCGDKSATSASSSGVSTVAPVTGAGGSSLYAAALSAASKATPTAAASGAGQSTQQEQRPTSAYYGVAAATVQASWPPYGGVAPGGQWGVIGNTSAASQTQQGYGYGQR